MTLLEFTVAIMPPRKLSKLTFASARKSTLKGVQTVTVNTSVLQRIQHFLCVMSRSQTRLPGNQRLQQLDALLIPAVRTAEVRGVKQAGKPTEHSPNQREGGHRVVEELHFHPLSSPSVWGGELFGFTNLKTPKDLTDFRSSNINFDQKTNKSFLKIKSKIRH